MDEEQEEVVVGLVEMETEVHLKKTAVQRGGGSDFVRYEEYIHMSETRNIM